MGVRSICGSALGVYKVIERNITAIAAKDGGSCWLRARARARRVCEARVY
jgi:hypothetical protein